MLSMHGYTCILAYRFSCFIYSSFIIFLFGHIFACFVVREVLKDSDKGITGTGNIKMKFKCKYKYLPCSAFNEQRWPTKSVQSGTLLREVSYFSFEEIKERFFQTWLQGP